MIGEGIELHIKGIRVDWDKIEEDSYFRDIDSIAEIEHQQQMMPMAANGEESLTDIMKSLMEKASLPLLRINSNLMEYIFSMNPKQPCLHRDS